MKPFTIHPIEADKSAVCLGILRALPDWFGIPEAVDDYAKDVVSMPMWGASVGGRTVGFVALAVHTPFAGEIHVMGVEREFHGGGIGRALIEAGQAHLRASRHRYLTVKTLSPRRESAQYAATRAFYERVGFVPLEEFPDLWGPANPCLMMIKSL